MHVWLNEKNHWIYQHLTLAQERMTEIVQKISEPTPLQERALKQAGRELLLAQSSDWAFILRAETSPEYARKRVEDHLVRFNQIYEWLSSTRRGTRVHGDPDAFLSWPEELESRDNLFPNINYRYWENKKTVLSDP